MRTRQGMPSHPVSREVWLALAELKNELSAASQAEFATYLIACALATEELEEAEDSAAVLALASALEVLEAAGW